MRPVVRLGGLGGRAADAGQVAQVVGWAGGLRRPASLSRKSQRPEDGNRRQGAKDGTGVCKVDLVTLTGKVEAMNSRTTINLLIAACTAELIVIAGLLWTSPPPLARPIPFEPLAARPGQKPPNRKAEAGQPGGSAATQPELARQNLALETELAAVKKELDARKSEISFSYGSVRDSGRFVGMTFRKMFETAAAREATEVQARMADNQINVLSLGPFIQDADVIESDPVAFAQFQGALISQVLGLPEQQETDVEALLRDLKTKSLKVETASPEGAELNDRSEERRVGKECRSRWSPYH